ncbi:MAG: glycosyltransferase family 2 protein [Candidatus Thiodiazotropha sp. (ex Monitilora ramsayi)]|nr:glycosyltransferase family 2 protein [Candidatus Thiodiazotropha sp. (ex Monitilora ramsayi)]
MDIESYIQRYKHIEPMAKYILAFITLYGISFTLWGGIGVIRYISEKVKKLHLLRFIRSAYWVFATLFAIIMYQSVAIILLVAAKTNDNNSTVFYLPYMDWSDFILVGSIWITLIAIYIGTKYFRETYTFGIAVQIPLFYWLFYVQSSNSLSAVYSQLYNESVDVIAVLLMFAILGVLLGGLAINKLSVCGKRRRGDMIASGLLLEKCRVGIEDVAVLVPAHNEDKTIHLCLDALKNIVPMDNVYVGSDGSTDNTVETVKRRKCNIADIQPNGGKAKAIKYLLDHFEICERYKAVLIMDADSEVDINYMKHALPLFDDPSVVAVAGHAKPKWKEHYLPSWGNFFIAYRVRLYRLLQAFIRYGQTWKYSNVSYIIPGFSSMYRCNVINQIDITTPGLLIEDFNMTFELHKKQLGKIAYTPNAVSNCEDPSSFRDYFNQIKRWNLGFWQTAKLHGIWASLFWASLIIFTMEVLLQSLVFFMLPAIILYLVIMPDELITFWLPLLGVVDLKVIDLFLGVILVDYLITVVIALIEDKPMLLVYGLGFVVLRWIDAFVFLFTLPLTYFVKSDGRWSSPSRI